MQGKVRKQHQEQLKLVAQISKIREEIVGVKIIKQAKEHMYAKEKQELERQIARAKKDADTALKSLTQRQREMS